MISAGIADRSIHSHLATVKMLLVGVMPVLGRYQSNRRYIARNVIMGRVMPPCSVHPWGGVPMARYGTITPICPIHILTLM